ncbi:MAG: hypothetical protein BJ554DRAFT_3481 [Olpidium bornovanus]|uniref:Uncharacterized protein n=1 Tax=Olpidium bornovanus TaxID=278681 RepID=A0A8H7ZNQ2_9FUNG|nr:MAG: hypothetical protein BJ554DRAFT_3481 [Olpidium bornovanus]
MAHLPDEPWSYNYNSMIPPREDPVAFTARRMPARLVMPNGKSFLGIRLAKASSAAVTKASGGEAQPFSGRA